MSLLKYEQRSEGVYPGIELFGGIDYDLTGSVIVPLTEMRFTREDINLQRLDRVTARGFYGMLKPSATTTGNHRSLFVYALFGDEGYVLKQDAFISSYGYKLSDVFRRHEKEIKSYLRQRLRAYNKLEENNRSWWKWVFGVPTHENTGLCDGERGSPVLFNKVSKEDDGPILTL
jgi:hypothetical protein